MRAKGVRGRNREDPQIKLALKLVSDLERGVDINDAGWVQFPPKIARRLMTSGCFEKNENVIRVSLSNPPEVGEDYIDNYLADARAAVSVLDEMKKVYGDEQLQVNAVRAGLAEMMISSSFPALPQAILRKEFGLDSWFACATKSTPDLITFLMSKTGGFPAKNYSTRHEDSSRVMEVLMWESVPEAFDWKTLWHLGILWYAHLLATKKGVGCDTNMLLVQNETKKMFKLDSDLPLEESVQKLKELTVFEFDREKEPVASWERIFRFPPWWL